MSSLLHDTFNKVSELRDQGHALCADTFVPFRTGIRILSVFVTGAGILQMMVGLMVYTYIPNLLGGGWWAAPPVIIAGFSGLFSMNRGFVVGSCALSFVGVVTAFIALYYDSTRYQDLKTLLACTSLVGNTTAPLENYGDTALYGKANACGVQFRADTIECYCTDIDGACTTFSGVQSNCDYLMDNYTEYVGIISACDATAAMFSLFLFLLTFFVISCVGSSFTEQEKHEIRGKGDRSMQKLFTNIGNGTGVHDVKLDIPDIDIPEISWPKESDVEDPPNSANEEAEYGVSVKPKVHDNINPMYLTNNVDNGGTDSSKPSNALMMNAIAKGKVNGKGGNKGVPPPPKVKGSNGGVVSKAPSVNASSSNDLPPKSVASATVPALSNPSPPLANTHVNSVSDGQVSSSNDQPTTPVVDSSPAIINELQTTAPIEDTVKVEYNINQASEEIQQDLDGSEPNTTTGKPKIGKQSIRRGSLETDYDKYGQLIQTNQQEEVEHEEMGNTEEIKKEVLNSNDSDDTSEGGEDDVQEVVSHTRINDNSNISVAQSQSQEEEEIITNSLDLDSKDELPQQLPQNHEDAVVNDSIGVNEVESVQQNLGEEDWIPVLDEASGNTYYVNSVTSETTWVNPMDPSATVDEDEAGESVWVPVLDESSGHTYYVNKLTHESSWELPKPA